MRVLKFLWLCWRHVKFLQTSQTCKKWNVQWLCVAMSMVSFMTSWNCLRLAASPRTQITCSWEIMWIVGTTVWRLSHCSFLSRCAFVLYLCVVTGILNGYLFVFFYYYYYYYYYYYQRKWLRWHKIKRLQGHLTVLDSVTVQTSVTSGTYS